MGKGGGGMNDERGNEKERNVTGTKERGNLDFRFLCTFFHRFLHVYNCTYIHMGIHLYNHTFRISVGIDCYDSKVK